MKIYSLLSYIDALSEADLLIDSFVTDNTLAVESITYNSKETKPYTMFICKGKTFKKDYLDEAVDNKIACYVSEQKYDTNSPVSYIIVKDIRKTMAFLANMFYDNVFKKLKLTGITGTKGKSTTAYFIKYILDEHLQNQIKKPSGILSTINVFDGRLNEPATLTTPEAIVLHHHFNNAYENGLEYMTMEVSSQALKYDRVLGIDFDIGVFLNISEDHISPSEHSNFEDYFHSKLKLFSQSKTAIINLNSDFSNKVLEVASQCEEVITFGLKENANVYGYNIKAIGNQLSFMVKTNSFNKEFIINTLGNFNVENALAAIAVALKYGIDVDEIYEGLKKAHTPGRMEILSTEDNSVIAIVDYAHNRLSFEKIFQLVKDDFKERKIITIFGCPGNKAFNRRFELGDLAGRYSDKVYLTADNPGYQTIEEICLDIKQHVTPYQCECFIYEDRVAAIESAILTAEKNSIILILGKGNETAQIVEGKNVPCPSDIETAKKYLSLLDQKALS